MSWSQLADALEVRPPNLPLHLEAAALRVLGLRPRTDAIRWRSSGGFTNRRSLIFGFDGGARDDLDVRTGAATTWNRTTVRLSLGYRSGEGEDEVVLDGSYVSQGWGNWMVWGGVVDRWYGPGWDAGLVLSRNADPIPGVGFFRAVPRKSDSWLLSWMGPWKFDGFLGVVGGGRDDFQDPLNVNLQLAFQPLDRFDITLTRGIMICGEGRPCGFEEWVRAIFAFFDLDNQDTPGEQDPSNQNASIALSYSMPVRSLQVSPLVEWFFEDEIDFMSVLVGARVLAPGKSGTWRFRLGYSDTYANRIMGGLNTSWWVPTPGKTYDHFIYTDGYTHDGRAIGHSLGGDGRLVSLETGWVSRAGHDVVVRARHADFRVNPLNVEPPLFRDTWIVEVGGSVALDGNRLGAVLRWTEDHPYDLGGEAWEVEGGFRLRIDSGN